MLEIDDFIDIFYSKGSVSQAELDQHIEELLDTGLNKGWVFTKVVEQYSLEKPIKGKNNLMLSAIQKLAVRPDFIYRLYKDGDLVYIGQSCSLNRRLLEHKKDGKVFDHVEAHMCSAVECANLIEAGMILKYLPPLNKNVNLDYARGWDGVEPEFFPIEKPTSLFIDTYSFTDKEYLREHYLFSSLTTVRVRNDRHIVPRWYVDQ